MAFHVIVGAGPVGAATARLLLAEGHRVRVVTRRGTALPGVEAISADAADFDAMRRATAGAAAIYNAVNPPYHRWATDWPPIAANLLDVAAANDAVVVTMSNLYGYGPVDGPMTEDTPLAARSGKGGVRARMWEQALAAQQEGRVRVTEARAADFIGPEVTGSTMGERVVPRVLAGKPVRLLGALDVPHALTGMADVARALVVLGTDERAWGRAWHVPTNAAPTQREAVAGLAAAAGLPTPRLSTMGRPVLRLGGLFSPLVRELPEILYQFERPFEVDSSAFTATFGIAPTPLPELYRTTVAWFRAQRSA